MVKIGVAAQNFRRAPTWNPPPRSATATMRSIFSDTLAFCSNISYTFFRISYTCRKHVSDILEKWGPLGVANIIVNENMFDILITNNTMQLIYLSAHVQRGLR